MDKQEYKKLTVMFNGGVVEFFMVSRYFTDEYGCAFETKQGFLTFEHSDYLWLINPLKNWPKEWGKT